MTELKTLKDITTTPVYLDFDRNPCSEDSENLAYCGGCNGDFVEVGCRCNMVNIKKLKEEAIKWIKAIQSGSGVKRDNFPEDMKGSIVKDNWHDSIFTLGLEYGFIIGLMEVLNLTEEDLK